MKMKLTIVSFLISFLLMSVYDPTGFQVIFNVSKLPVDSISINQIDVDSSKMYIEMVWSTGDTGFSIQVDQPGMYICCVKDVWKLGNEYIKPFIFKGYPDSVKIDTLSFDLQENDQNGSMVRTKMMIKDGKVTNRTFKDTAWISGGKFYYTETKYLWTGFWSGKLDTIIIRPNESLPLNITARVMNADNSFFSGRMVKMRNKKPWRAAY